MRSGSCCYTRLKRSAVQGLSIATKVTGRRVDDGSAVLGPESKLLGHRAEPKLVRPDHWQRPLGVQMPHGAHIKRKASAAVASRAYDPRLCDVSDYSRWRRWYGLPLPARRTPRPST